MLVIMLLYLLYNVFVDLSLIEISLIKLKIKI